MRLFLICDNIDTSVGMRLAGIEGCVVNNKNEAALALENALKDENIAIILMNQTLCEGCKDIIRAFNKAHSSPVVVEIPDRSAKGSANTLTRYIKETVGIDI